MVSVRFGVEDGTPRLTLVYSPLIGNERLEQRALRGGHRCERQPAAVDWLGGA